MNEIVVFDHISNMTDETVCIDRVTIRSTTYDEEDLRVGGKVGMVLRHENEGVFDISLLYFREEALALADAIYDWAQSQEVGATEAEKLGVDVPSGMKAVQRDNEMTVWVEESDE